MDTLWQHQPEFIAFGRYRLLPGRAELHTDCGRAVSLGPRATAVLMALIGARGSVISQEDLLEHVWPGQDIHASNLRVQIAALRKALAEDRNLIGTVAGRGYVFSGQLGALASAGASFPSLHAPRGRPCTRRLPLSMTELIGRERQMQEALERLAGSRLLTLTGTGGIGKTQLALAMAHRLSVAPGGAACWAELGEVDSAAGLGAAVACALGVNDADDPDAEHCAASLAAHIGHQPLLIVLDNCEHLADPVARLVEALLQRCPQLSLLATSRQPLLAAGETVWRVPPLAVPDVNEREGAHLLRYSAVQLFVARVRAAGSPFNPTPHMAQQIGSICRRLEGLPLAIELAAACVPALGVDQTAAGLDDVLRLLRRGRRNAPARHQSMRAALDWSYALLSEPMRVALHRLATLPDGFTIDDAVCTLGPRGLSPFEAIDALAGLVSHSLAQVDHVTTPARYRLPATTRAYALEGA